MRVFMDERIKELRVLMEKAKTKRHPDSSLIAILHKAQELFGYLSRDVLDEVSVFMNIPAAHIWGVATFYYYFKLTPPGKHVISICLGTACYVKGAQDIFDAISDELNIGIGETSKDQMFTLQEARCLGACGLAPVVMIDGKIFGELTPKKMLQLIQDYRKKD
jgi:NADH:ubiquinone oxidoreductase subunit E